MAKKPQQESEVHMYLGSAFLGVNPEIMSVIGTYADHYSAQVFHIGPIATDDEIKMWRYRTEKLRTWEKQMQEMAQSVDLSAEESLELVGAAYDQLLEKGSKNVRNVDWDDLSEDGLGENEIRHLSVLLQGKITVERARADMKRLKDAQHARVDAILQHTPNTRFVFSKDGAVDFEATVSELGKRYEGTEIKYKHIHALSMLANGARVSHAPITKRTIDAVAHVRKSTILAHPIPMADSRNAEGLNNAKNHMTTGMLYMPEDSPESTKDIHKGKHLPGFVVAVHTKEGYFFANNIIVETRGSVPFIAEDGLIFGINGVIDGGSENALLGNDFHAPYQHNGVVNAMIDAGNRAKIRAVLLNGDVQEGEATNRHGERRHLEGKRIINDLAASAALTDKLKGSIQADEYVWVLGNHEMWQDIFVDKNPAVAGLLDWATVSKTHFPDYKFIMRNAGENTVYRFGSLALRHGDEESLEAAIEALGDTTNGHWHRYYRIGQSGKLGAACRLGPGYIGNNLTAWQSQFGFLTSFEGWTQTSYKTVLHNDETKTSKYVFRNKVYTVDWKE